jgi:hypothetical protein
MMGYHDLSAAGGRSVSTQDRAVQGGDVAAQEAGVESEAAAGASGGLGEAARLRAMQRRWIQRKAGGAGGGGAAAIPGGAGAPLGAGVRTRMENTLGADLSGVRVHTGGDSAQAAEAFGARAFTVGSDVHFGHGEFAPGSKEGDRLLAHELTHVVQGQKSGIQRKADAGHDGGAGHGDHEAGGHEVSEPGDAAEHEADAMGDHAADQLHGGGGEHGGDGAKAAAASSAAPQAGGAEASKKISRKPMINSVQPDIGRKIYRATGPKPPPIPDAAKKGKGPAAPAQAGAGAAAAAPAKNPEEQKAEEWCTANLPKLQTFDAKTAPFSVLTMFESGLAAYKAKFKDNAKVQESIALLDKKKLEVDTTGAAEVTSTVLEPVKVLNAQIPGSYQAAGALTARMQRWKSYFVDASDGPKGFAAVQAALKAIQTFQAEVIKNRDAAVEATISQMNGIDASDPKAMEKLEAAFKHGDAWLHASGLPGAPDKLQLATMAKATKQGQIEGTLKAKQEQEKKDQEKKKQDQKKDPAQDAKSGGAGAAAPAAAAAPKDQKKDGGAGAAGESAGAASPAGAKNAPVLPAVQAQPHAPEQGADAKAGHGAGAAGHKVDEKHGADPHAAGAAESAHGPEKGHGPDGKHAEHDPEEEKKKLEEEKLEIEREQLEVEMELACQQYIKHVAWGNAGLGLLASLGGIAIPGLHIAGAIKSGAAAAAVIKAEYDAKFLTFAIKHLDPKDIKACLQTIHDKEQSFSKLKEQIELFLAGQEGGKAGAKKDMAEAHGKRHVAGEAAKGEGPELAGEGGGLALHLGEHAIEHAGGEAMGAIAGELAGILPFVSVGFGVKSALAAGDKVMNLRMELIALQDKAEKLGAQTGRKKI